MALAWSEEWFTTQMELAKKDKDFQEEAEDYERLTTMHILADPENGVPEDQWHGFNPPSMDKCWWGLDNRPAEADEDYIIEGTYADWHAVNEGTKGLVASLLDQSLLLRKGSTSYIAMFVPAVERFYEISRELTDSYDGDYKPER
jgi:hypothetical protein